MQGLWLEDGKFCYRDDLAMPRPDEGELLVQVLKAGICGTDVELQRGYYGYTGTPGHEFVGQVVSAGTLRGQRIVADINIGCGQCGFCLSGLANHCQNRQVIGIKNHPGAFADYLTVPEKNCYMVPAALSDDLAVLVEPVAAALEIVEQVSLAGVNQVLVVGAGRLGILIANVLASFNIKVLVLVRSEKNRHFLQRDGIKVVTSVDENSLPLVVECSGQAAGFAGALAAVKARGTIVMKSTYRGELTFNASKIVVDEICLLGSRCGPFVKAIAWLQENSLDFLDFACYPFSAVADAFDAAQHSGVYKILFVPEASLSEQKKPAVLKD